MTERLRCLVPFCRRTRRDDGRFEEWICAKHWREVSRALRRRYHRARRRAERFRSPVDCHRASVLWRYCREQAIARAGMLP